MAGWRAELVSRLVYSHTLSLVWLAVLLYDILNATVATQRVRERDEGPRTRACIRATTGLA